MLLLTSETVKAIYGMVPNTEVRTMLGCIAVRFLWLHAIVLVAASLAPIGWMDSPLRAQSLAPSPESDVEALIVRLKHPPSYATTGCG